jgi:hypothetical protein
MGRTVPSGCQSYLHLVAELETRSRRFLLTPTAAFFWSILDLFPLPKHPHTMKTEPIYNHPRPAHAIEKPPDVKPKPKAATRAKLGSRDLREDRGTRQIKNAHNSQTQQHHP